MVEARIKLFVEGLCKLSRWDERELWIGRLAKKGASSGQGQENGREW